MKHKKFLISYYYVSVIYGKEISSEIIEINDLSEKFIKAFEKENDCKVIAVTPLSN